jgi:hypothetical protein
VDPSPSSGEVISVVSDLAVVDSVHPNPFRPKDSVDSVDVGTVVSVHPSPSS